MPKCKLCGKKGLFLKLDADGYCSDCGSKSIFEFDCEQTNAKQTRAIQSTLSGQSSLSVIDTAFKIPNNVLSLLWFLDGPRKNYTPRQATRSLLSNGISLSLDFNRIEPSAISLKHEIGRPMFTENIPRPQYYPEYSQITPDQRYIYLKALENPLNENIDVGYIFLFYYGLERHLLEGNFVDAFEMILDLRKVHKNTSFQTYSFVSLLYSCIARNEPAYLAKLMSQFNEENTLKNFDLFILSKNLLSAPITAKELMSCATSFEFSNRNYIKTYPELFEKTLDQVITDKCGTFVASNYVKMNKVPKYETSVYANLSLVSTAVVPSFASVFLLKQQGYSLLSTAHEIVKTELHNNRADYVKQTSKKDKPIVIYPEDAKYPSIDAFEKVLKLERRFVPGTIDSVRDQASEVAMHFEYQLALSEIYKDRDYPRALTDIIYLCKADIELFKRNPSLLGDFPTTVYSFSKLITIYEKQKEFEKAIDICELAVRCKIDHNHDNEYFKNKLNLLHKRVDKQ